MAGGVPNGDAKAADRKARGLNIGRAVGVRPCSAGMSVGGKRRQGRWGTRGKPYVGRISVRVYAVFGRVAAVCRCTTCAAMRGQGHDNWRISVRHTLAPTKARRSKAAEVGEGHAKRAHAPPLQPAAWGVKPKAGPAGRIVDSRCMKVREDRRRGTRRIGAAAAIERPAVRSALRGAVPGEVRAGSAGAPAPSAGSIATGSARAVGAVADALVQSTVHRR